MAPNYLLDAGPLIGLLDADDQWHEWSRKTLSSISGPMLTTEAVVAEACYHLRNLRPALAAVISMIDGGALILVSVAQGHAARVGQLLVDYEKMDFGDATLVVLSEIHPKAKLVTLDVRDFTVYRRSDGEAVPIVAPSRLRL